MKSTPTLSLLSEAGTTSVEFRHTRLATKLLRKNARLHSNLVTLNITNLFTACMTNQGFWRNKPVPSILKAFETISWWQGELGTTSNDACFEYPRRVAFYPIQELASFLTKNGTNNNTEFLQTVNTHYPNSTPTIVYTDASVDPITGYAGIGVYCPPHISFSGSLKTHTTICSAELLAILKALQLAEHIAGEILIATESQSATASLQRLS